MLHHAGIESVVIERQSREHVLSRIRAGVLEWGTVEVLRASRARRAHGRRGPRPHRDRHRLRRRAPLLLRHRPHADTQFMAYGQTMIQEDLYNAADQLGLDDSCSRSTTSPCTTSSATAPIGHVFTHDGAAEARSTASSSSVATASTARPSRRSRPTVLRTYEKAYPFGWLGILSETPPLEHLVYCNSPRGFALGLAAQPDAEPLLRPVPARRHGRRVARCALLGRVARPLPRPGVVADRDRPVDREVDRSAAQLRRRADALRQPVPGRRRRPHRAAHRRQGPQSRRVRRVLPGARARASTTPSATTTTSTATPRWHCAGCGRRSASRGG